ncbi:conserved Plasmodium protein, unknown function [Plasmodium berghei]|uniref:DNA/RNA-binding protein, putative n=2 Tax=Plasmodium berghei TaxID=5821 RepID=A0A509AFE4_PLABA|nr:DNA/RNA-binding protein, putative [Plasmodium berghei ANKA]CXI15154.1 conserved Plasmodium protein, unknown function [Plasmodium berghei]SCM19545.1 conserved Plasmodium protein, unknown function [Plasmodium berghei]SCN23294.1 conserved Plasmodium protein, unknown function [Plasmodium berghei]SCO59007.1 conserved Plasmodium protein, unknown function [Plasmodium berghei]SCO59525.1 conserved Plasmodium protein, unknown function [Plasmodium berghei]|eukprot:XP_034420518.1 DNA/RNA-binding protein, putative [Plasmodium berghei ANKA]
MNQKTPYKLLLDTKPSKIQKHVNDCLENMKMGEVEIIARNYAISKAFSVLEVLKTKVSNLNYSIKYNNLEATGPNRRQLLEINISVSFKN